MKTEELAELLGNIARELNNAVMKQSGKLTLHHDD